MAKRKNFNPNRFQKQNNKALFSFDPIRRDVLKWGAFTGLLGGFFMIQTHMIWQLLGVFVVAILANHQISKASRRIPRWHATLLSFIGVMATMIGVIILGTIIMAYYSTGE